MRVLVIFEQKTRGALAATLFVIQQKKLCGNNKYATTCLGVLSGGLLGTFAIFANREKKTPAALRCWLSLKKAGTLAAKLFGIPSQKKEDS